MKKTVFQLVLFLSLLITLRRDVFSTTLTLSNGLPITLSDENQEFSINALLQIDANDGTIYYLRGVFYKEQTNNYCGYTWNGTDWFKGPNTNEGWKQYLEVQISSKSAQTQLKAKFDRNDSGCNDSGEYLFKVQRFTQGGSGIFDDQNAQNISVTLNAPSLTPSKIPTSTTINTHKPIPTNTSLPKPTIIPTQIPTTFNTQLPIKPSQKDNSQSLSKEKEGTNNSPTLVAENILSESSPSEKIKEIDIEETKNFPVAIYLLAGAGILFISAGLVFLRNKRNKSN